MDEKELKRQLLELAEEKGWTYVCIALQGEGLSPSTSERLSVGTHTGGFKRKTVAAARAVLIKEGKAQAS